MPTEETQILATPDAGDPILYFPNDQDDSTYYAALCTKVEGPGRVTIIYFPPNSVPRHKNGVNWMCDNRRIEPRRPFRANGCWDFNPNWKPRNAGKLHKDFLARQQKAKEHEEEQRALKLQRDKERMERGRRQALAQPAKPPE